MAIELKTPLSKSNKIQYFYPDTTSIEKATIFEITSTTQLNIDFKLPENIKARKFFGEILTENGNSVGGSIEVSLDSLEDPNNLENIRFGETRINTQGRFMFYTLENEEYWLHVWVVKPKMVKGEYKQIRELIISELVKIGEEKSFLKVIVSLRQNKVN